MTANTATLDTEALQHLTGYTRDGDIERCLRKNGIPFIRGRGGRIFTTTDAVNQALGIRPAKREDNDEIEFA